MRGAVEVEGRLINLDLITTMSKDDEGPDWYRIYVSYAGGGNDWLDFTNKEERDKFYNDFKNANP